MPMKAEGLPNENELEAIAKVVTNENLRSFAVILRLVADVLEKRADGNSDNTEGSECCNRSE